ncbi:MAG TPA: hypothetical protein PLF50_04065 [Candidatus Cloacimonadota bacterium]|nr:hypothetical protein [Candidatus Cloacimonadota bacterium]
MAVLIVVIVVALILSAAYYYKTNPELPYPRKTVLIVLRTIVWSLVLLFLLKPVYYYVRHYTQKPVAILLKDNSSSMNLLQQGKPKSVRSGKAYAQVKKRLQEQGYIVREYNFADGLQGKSDRTYLVPALLKLQDLYPQTPVKGVYVFSDGRFRDPDLHILNNYKFPVYTIADTLREVVSDLSVTELRHNLQGYRNEPNLAEVTLQADAYKGKAAVALWADGKKVEEKQISFASGPVQTVSFSIRLGSLGLHKLEATVTASGIKEASLANNKALSAIDIQKDKEKILLLTDVPNWDAKFILDALKENNHWEALAYTVKSDRLFDGENPVELKDWDAVSAVIVVNTGFLHLGESMAAALVNKVNAGCGLLYFGLPITQLNSILPLQLSNLKSSYKGLLQFLPASQSYAVFQIDPQELEQIPPVDYYYLVPNKQSEVVAVLDNAQKSPAIAINSLSGGKVVGFSVLNLWRWQLQSRTQGYKTFITDLVTWLLNKEAGRFNALYEPSYYLDEPVSIKLTAGDELRRQKQNLAPFITVYNAKNDSVFGDFLTERQGAYNIQFRLTQPDEYHFTIKDKVSGDAAQGKFLVHAQNLEARDLGNNLSLLGWIAQQTGGKFLSLEAADKYQPPLAKAEKQIEQKEFPLYKKWYILVLFIFSFCLELLLRRVWGLL